MLPLKISSLLARPPLPQAQVSPLRARLGAAESPTVVTTEPGQPEHERRSMGNRRLAERRASELPAFLDTRVGQSRRRNAGRRTEDQQLRIAISVKA